MPLDLLASVMSVLLCAPTSLLPLGVLLKTITLLTARFWSQVLLPTLQIPIITLYFAALWWRGLTALLSLCVSFPLIDVGSRSKHGIPSAYIVVLFFFLNRVLVTEQAPVTGPEGWRVGSWTRRFCGWHSKQLRALEVGGSLKVAWATVGSGTAAACRPLQGRQQKSCDTIHHPSECWWDLLQ
eukprot:1140131-Pelagomonas_calceolata.AAC.3